tara:strand:+ start:1 stop:1068 length:1068 start_codon:yes stop_codon:yes gene_type:complete
VFVVGHIRDWRGPAEVLFDRKVLSWDTPPRRKKGEKTTRKTTFRLTRSDQRVEDDIAGTIAARDYKSATDLVSETDLISIAGGHSKSNGSGIKNDGSMYTLTAHDKHSILENSTVVFEPTNPDGVARVKKEEISPTLNAMTGGNRQPCIVNVSFKEDYPEDYNGLMHCGDEVDKVSVRKHKVDVKKLQDILRKHRKPIKKISEDLDVNKTTVEHWFRTDKSFSIPSPNDWLKLKKYLNIKTDEFDKSIMEFEEKDNVFDSSKRIYDADGSYPTMTASNTLPKVFVKKSVEIRRLTPLECERLQGLPDNYTQIPYRGKPKEECPSSKRYEACGRGMSINVMEFLGTRIKEVDKKYV